MASSSSQRKYEVFLSFRGEDTRKGFTSHLAAALAQKQIQFFIDDEELKKGDEISPALANAIETPDISVIIFSKDYASSKWCLSELVKILDCKKMNGQIVIPVFYHVDPSDVRKQSGSFGEAFVEYEKNFPHKVQKWRDALIEASSLSGHDATESRTEAELVKEIAADISKKLEDMSDSTDLDGFVGLNSRIEEMKSLLCLESRDVRIVGIWGMGGIGKTTIASAVFHQISRHFQGKCFMANVREESNKMGVIHVRDEVISQVLGDKDLKIGTLVIHQNIRKRLRQVKMLIVLDDVHDGFTQLESLAGELDKFTTGSRIIITTRDKQVLDKCGVNYVYEVEGLEHKKALELFYRKAFRQNNCPPGFLGLSLEVVHYARNNPLALEVLGSSLYQKSKQQWEDRLHNLRLISEPNIYKVLKISYDELNSKEKEMFLDIACFFKGENLDLVTRIQDNPISVRHGLNNLVGKSLVKISSWNWANGLQMHDLLQEMGQTIVCQESVKEPGKRSRLWDHIDVSHVLKKNKKALKLKFIDLSHSQYLIRMPDLSEAPNLERINLLNCTNLVSGPSSIQNFNHLSMLCFKGCKSLRSFPSNLHFVCPVTINCGGCVNLAEFPQISGSVTELILWETAIKEVPSSIESLTNLEVLDLAHCKRLNRLSASICKLKSLGWLRLYNCSKLESFPGILEDMARLEYIDLRLTAIKELPSSVEHLEGLKELRMEYCHKLGKLPDNLGSLRSLKHLHAGKSAISQLPSSITDLKQVEEISFYGCRGLVLTSVLSGLSSLQRLDLRDCDIIEIPQDIGSLLSLEKLDISGNNFESLPASIKQLSQLRWLYLRNCNRLKSLPELPFGLCFLDARNCEQLQSLPEIPSCLEELDEIDTSILETLSNHSPIYFNFINCLKLNDKANKKILADSKLRIQRMAIASLRLSMYVKEYREPPVIKICLPGNEIPDWFSHQCLGSSLTIQLPHHSCNGSFIGFSFCIVIELEKDHKARHRIYYHFEIKTPSGTKYDHPSVFEQSFHSDQVILGFFPCWNIELLDNNVNISLQFSVQYPCSEKGPKVHSCGVCPVYAHPNGTKPKTFTVNVLPPNEEE